MVETLAGNLRATGRSVFFDRWELVPGRSFVTGLAEGLQRSRAMVLVVSPEAYQSGWVGRELDETLAARGRDFPIIPVIHGGIEGAFPFLASLHWVDFRAPVAYREAFQRLLCGLDGTAPGPRPWFDGLLTEPPPVETPPPPPSVIDATLDRLNGGVIVSLLARDGVPVGSIAATLKASAQKSFPPGHIHHLTLPWLPPGQPLAPIHAQIALDAGLRPGIDDYGAFWAALTLQLQSHPSPRLWLVTGFETTTDDIRDMIANTVRGMAETHGASFQVVLVGGEKLHEAKYAGGARSILSNAFEIHWPDPTPADIGPDDESGRLALAAAGGNGTIARDLRGRPLTAQTVADSQTLWTIVRRLASADGAKLARLAGMRDLGPYHPYLPDDMTRRLYWRNLIAVAPGQRLRWRSELIREAVAMVLHALTPEPA